MGQTIQKELGVIPSQITYWTDSTTVLSCIKSQGTEIKEVSDPETWRHVPGCLNVADDCLRGLTAQDLLQDSGWINGPYFLLQGEDCWPNQAIGQQPTNLKSTTSFSIQRRPLRAPIYYELPHGYFCLSEIVTSCHHKNEHVKVTKGPLSVEELMNAEEFWIKKLKFTSMT